MATLFSHVVTAAAIGSAFDSRKVPKSIWISGALCAVIPDADVFGMALGVSYEDFWGHRGFTHSILFAALLAPIFTWGLHFQRPHKWAICLYLLLATASHGVFDALTNGGLGIAFFSPIDNSRYFLPFQPIEVSPIGGDFWSEAAYPVLKSEIIWIWIPSGVFMAICLWLRRTKLKRAESSAE